MASSLRGGGRLQLAPVRCRLRRQGLAPGAADALWCGVKRTLDSRCIVCHNEMKTAGAPMSLKTYTDLTAPAISDPSKKVFQVVGVRVHDKARPMPPQDALSADQLTGIDSWVAAGAPVASDPTCAALNPVEGSSATAERAWLQFLLLSISGWMTRDHQRVTEYLQAENAVLREQLRGCSIRYTDAQRRRLATAAKKLGRKALKKLDTLVTPDTLLRWYALSQRSMTAVLDAAAANSGGRSISSRSYCGWPRRIALAATRASAGALYNLGHEIFRDMLKNSGLKPVRLPSRSARRPTQRNCRHADASGATAVEQLLGSWISVRA